MIDISRISEAIRAEGLDYWLFCNFHHRDALADSVLGIPHGTTNSRFWFYLVPAQGEPVRIVHAIEAGILGALPGRLESYSSRSARVTASSGASTVSSTRRASRAMKRRAETSIASWSSSGPGSPRPIAA